MSPDARPRAEPSCMDVVLADVMGHGAPAALVAAMVKVSVFASAERHEHPAEIVRDLKRSLCKGARNQPSDCRT